MAKSTEELYTELIADVAAVVVPLLEISMKFLRNLGDFFPHGYVLMTEGRDMGVGAIDGSPDNTTDDLPLLHEGLRMLVRNGKARAIGVAEHVTITPEGGSSTSAIKVLLEHRDGLCVAVYLPFEKQRLGGYAFGQAFTVAATPEVNPQWETNE